MNTTGKNKEKKRLLRQKRERLRAEIQNVDAELEDYSDGELALMIVSLNTRFDISV